MTAAWLKKQALRLQGSNHRAKGLLEARLQVASAGPKHCLISQYWGNWGAAQEALQQRAVS